MKNMDIKVLTFIVIFSVTDIKEIIKKRFTIKQRKVLFKV